MEREKEGREDSVKRKKESSFQRGGDANKCKRASHI